MKEVICPDADVLATLLENEAIEGTEWADHLETCAECRQALIELAADVTSWEGAARYLPQGDTDVPDWLSSEPGLKRVMVELKTAPPLFLRSLEVERTEEEEISLSFLRPPEPRPAAHDDYPELLGYLGEYEVREVIGRGGMGIVLLAFDPALHRMVAIKVMAAAALVGSATARRRFTREAQAAAAVCHDHLVTVYGVHETDGLPYLVMQYIAGESLQTRLDRSGPLELVEVVRIGLQTASGLAAAHAQGLIHRDIKPANLLLENGLARVRITDFGLARMTDDVQLTQNGVVLGTPEYMAPEQATCKPVDHRADLFSLGSVLYAMCTGVPPFRGWPAVAVLRQVCDQTPTPIRSLNPEVSVWLETLIARLMAKNPAERFRSAAEVAALLEGYLAHLRQPMTVPAPEIPPASPDDSCELLETELQPTVAKRLPPRLWPAVLLLLAGLGLGMVALFAGDVVSPAPQAKQFQERYFSFKGHTAKSDDLDFYGPDAEQCVRFEREGLRITTPLGFPDPRPSTGVVHHTVGKGDFELTTSFEILRAPEPENAGSDQTRFTLDAVLTTDLDVSNYDVATFSYRVGPPKKGRTQFLAWLKVWDPATGKHQQRGKGFATKAKTGRLRMVRTGAVLSYKVAEGSSEVFTLLEEYPFSKRDLTEVRLVESTGGPKAELDVRITDLRIRAESLPGLPESVTVALPQAEATGGLLAAELFGLMLTLLMGTALGVWLYRRQSRRAEPPTGSTLLQDTLPISFQCSTCGKLLRAKLELAGKKVKCSQCGKAVPVPETTPNISPQIW